MFFGWPPDVFWNATPEELAAVIEASMPQGRAVDGAVLARLREAFPDG